MNEDYIIWLEQFVELTAVYGVCQTLEEKLPGSVGPNSLENIKKKTTIS